jgi:hypothetical protein
MYERLMQYGFQFLVWFGLVCWAFEFIGCKDSSLLNGYVCACVCVCVFVCFRLFLMTGEDASGTCPEVDRHHSGTNS